MSDLSRLSLAELKALREAYLMAADAFLGFMNQPRCKGALIQGALEDENDRAAQLAGRIVAEAAARGPTELRDRIMRARIVAGDAVEAEQWTDALHIIADVLAPEGVSGGEGRAA